MKGRIGAILGMAALAGMAPAAQITHRQQMESISDSIGLITPKFRDTKPMIVRNQRQRRKLNRQVPQRLNKK